MPTQQATKRPAPERVPGVLADDEAALLRAIAADPEDDALRLVYADWLEEHGRDDHAAFVRVQCEFARVEAVEGEWAGSSSFDHCLDLLRRCRALTPRREGAWSVPPEVPIAFSRGLPGIVSCGPREFVEHGGEWLKAAPTLHGLRLTGPGQPPGDPQALAASEHLGRLTRLWVNDKVPAPVVEALLASPHLSGLTSLDLLGAQPWRTSALSEAHHLPNLARLELLDNRLDDDRLAELLRSPAMSRLTYLGLQKVAIGAGGASALAGCQRLSGLTTLDLVDNEIGTVGVRALAASPHLGRLRHLRLTGAGLSAPAARAPARATGVSGLTSLELIRNQLRDAGVRELAGGDGLAGLERLELGGNYLTDRALEALARSTSLACLRSLEVNDDGIGDAGMLALARSPHLAGLRELAIGPKNVTVAGLKAGTSRLDRLKSLSVCVGNWKAALATCGLFGLPATLNLRGNSLTDAAVVRLAAMPGMRNVVRLDLSFNEIRDRGVVALVQSPYLDHLEELNLGYNKVGAAGVEALLSGAGLPRLTRLLADSNPLKDAGLERLAASPGTARLTSLDLSGIQASDAGVDSLIRSPHLTNLRHLNLGENRVSQKVAQRLIASPNLERLGLLTMAMVWSTEAFEALRAEAARRGITLGD